MDEKILREFIDWLPELTPQEMYYCCLFARSKYTKDVEGKNGIPHIKSDKAQLKRFTATKDRLYQKIQQLECPIGSYYQNTHIIPQEALALYITVNPRDLWKATKNSLKHFAEVVCTEGKTMNPQADAMSEIQRSQGTKYYTVADIDSKDPLLIDFMSNIIGRENFKVLETRGGYHFIINHREASLINNKWYTYTTQMEACDQIGDIMIPVPGTYQGGHTPKFII